VLYYGSFDYRTGGMAERKQAEDDFNPRHRIVGAAVLVAVAVIVLSLVLRDHPSDTQPAPAATVPTPETQVVAPVSPPGSPPVPDHVDTAPAPGSGSNIVTKVVPVPVESGTETPVPPPSVSPPPPSKPVVEPPPPKTASATPKPAPVTEKGWMVQVGAFSHIENARSLQEKLKHKGIPAVLVPPVPAKGKTVRVEAGPYKDAAAAKAAAARIHAELGIKGIVRGP
jgi:DedD protein